MPIKYLPVIPEPVEGQAILENFSRILRYKVTDEVFVPLQREMPLYESAVIRQLGRCNYRCTFIL